MATARKENSSEILRSVQSEVGRFYTSEYDNRLVLHNYYLAGLLVEECLHLSEEAGLETDIRDNILLPAAWFFFTGYLVDYKEPASASIQYARRIMEGLGARPEVNGLVILTLRAAWGEREPESEAEGILTDAVNGLMFGEEQYRWQALLRLELELMRNQTYEDTAWARFRLQQLLSVKFHTLFGKRRYEPFLSANVLRQKQELARFQKKVPPVSPEARFPFSGLGPNISQRAIHTFFRSNYRNHINLSAIADNKANIMISVNAILISVIITILSYRSLAEANPVILLPSVIFLVTGLTSLIFAILSARPKVTSLIRSEDDRETIRRNLVFFGNFVQLDLDQYESAMEEMFRKDGLLIGNMTRDLYFLGKVLDKKYKYLTLSYNIFMLGFIATVVSFLAAMF